MYIDAIITLKHKATRPRYHCMHVVSTKAKKISHTKKVHHPPRARGLHTRHIRKLPQRRYHILHTQPPLRITSFPTRGARIRIIKLIEPAKQFLVSTNTHHNVYILRRVRRRHFGRKPRRRNRLTGAAWAEDGTHGSRA